MHGLSEDGPAQTGSQGQGNIVNVKIEVTSYPTPTHPASWKVHSYSQSQLLLSGINHSLNLNPRQPMFHPRPHPWNPLPLPQPSRQFNQQRP